MEFIFKELAYAETPMGVLSLRYRTEPVTGTGVYEIKLNDEFLMSSMFTVAERKLATLGLALLDGDALDVVVGGLGLGYTAKAVLDDNRLRSLTVVDALNEVIQWHQERKLPLGNMLAGDERCRFVHGDFFAMAKGDGFDPDSPSRRFHAILLDVDHSPRLTLHPSHAWLYEKDGLQRLAEHLYPGGVFALWSNDQPDDAFCSALSSVFPETMAQVVKFHNPLQDREAFNTIYTARAADVPAT